MRSVVVVFPASMCAMIPMFRVFSIETGRSAIFSAKLISLSTGSGGPPHEICDFAGTPGLLLPSVPVYCSSVSKVRESLVAFGHPVGLFLSLHGAASVLGRVQQFKCQLF